MRYVAVLWALLAIWGGFAHAEEYESSLGVLRVGHWVEVRGEGDGDRFHASKVELLEPERYEVLVGRVPQESVHRRGFALLGQSVAVVEKTEWEGDLTPETVGGRRVKLEGYYRDPAEFSAREISPREEGRDRVSGRIESLRKTASGVRLQVQRFTIDVPNGVVVEHEAQVEEISLAPARGETAEVDDDDLFGEGVAIGSDARLTSQFELRVTDEDNFNLESDDPEDRTDTGISSRVRIDWRPASRLRARIEGRAQGQWRDDEEDGASSDTEARLGETYLYWTDLFGGGIDLQIGRQDFDDRREWLYDQDLDGLRLFVERPRFDAELSVTTSLSDASLRDEETTNLIAYISNGDEQRHLAAYAIHRDIGLEDDRRSTHVGGRLNGRWFGQDKSWLEVAFVDAELDGGPVEGWAVDLGMTWTPDFAAPYAFTLGYAYGSGDKDPNDRVDRTFRQTGLHDNNDKWGGVTSFRYYGELMEPELANLQIVTAGFGTRFAERTSLDLVLHHYQQVVLSDHIVDSELDEDPEGEDGDLGWELDAILGWRETEIFDVEIVGAWFRPGSAFDDDASDAFLAKVQIRARF